MISDEKKQPTISREKDVFLQTINIIKEKPIWAAVIIFFSMYFSGILSTALKAIVSVGSENPTSVSFGLKALIQWCTSLTGLICLLLSFVFEYLLWRKKFLPKIEIDTGTKDDREFKYADEHPYGTAKPNTAEDLDDILEFKDIEDTLGTILGYDERIGKVVSIPTIQEFERKAKERNWTQNEKTNNTRNRNTLVIGSPGTLKSRAIIMNEILQSIRANESIIVTDPKADLYEKTHNILEKYGYDVKMFNLKDQEYSDSCNMVTELEGDSTFAKIYAETLVSNANEHGEQFWNDNAMNFIKACLMLDNIDAMGKLYDFISGRSLEEFENIFRSQDERSVAFRAYNIFRQCNEQVKRQIINGIGIMIDVFQDEKVRNITNTNEMDLTKPAREKCAYFVITSDQHRTFDYLAVLFWTMISIKLVEYIDKNRDENGNPTTRPVHLLLDEFPNIGAIPDFNRKLSTIRSRLLYSTIVIQNIPQLMNRYPSGMHEEIFSDCDFVAFLGCNDNTTAKYVSELTGIASIEVTTENRAFDNEKMAFYQSSEMRKVKSIGQRTVMNADEVRSIENIDLLIFIRGVKSVYQCKKFDYSKHPLLKELTPYKVTQHIPQWKKDLEAQEAEKMRYAREILAKREAEKQRKEENERKARKDAEREKKAREKAIESEQNIFFNQMNQLQFENIFQMKKDVENKTDEKPAAEEIVIDNQVDNESVFNDMDRLLQNMEDKSKSSKPQKKRKPIVIDNENGSAA